eukprot:8754103-Pyramimonas_sp.AAC.1
MTLKTLNLSNDPLLQHFAGKPLVPDSIGKRHEGAEVAGIDRVHDRPVREHEHERNGPTRQTLTLDVRLQHARGTELSSLRPKHAASAPNGREHSRLQHS